MSVPSLLSRLRGHFEQYVARYSVLALAVLAPASGLLGTVAAKLGGAATPGGRIALGAASAVATAIAGVTFIRNLGIWQMLDQFGAAPGVQSIASKPLAAVLNNVAGSTAETSGTIEPDADSQSVLEPSDGVPPDLDPDESEAASTTSAGAA